MSATAAKSCGSPAVYHRRQPERTLLYRVVQDHLATWLALHDDGCGGHAPALTEREFRRYLECGILAHGFARARCPDCGHDFLVAYSCPTGISFGHKCRGVCPSCTTRRMVETAAHLTDHVFPRLPVRQWVLLLPKRLRYHLDDAKLQNAVLHSLLHGIEQGLRESLPETDGATHINPHIGAVVFIRRFGGLLNAHLHFHVLMIDGVFCDEEAGHLHFQETCLTAKQMAHLQRTIRQRIVRLFVRRGLLDKAEGQAMITCEHDGGFSLDTGVRIEAHDWQGLERLLRYCARPAFALERLRQLGPEHLVYESKKPGPGDKVSVLLTPHQLLDRLSALIPPPRRHRHRYYGVLAPNSPWRNAVTALAAAESACNEGKGKVEAETEEMPVRQAARYVWALLLARIYEVFPLICPKCAGMMKIIAFIDEGEAIREILHPSGRTGRSAARRPGQRPAAVGSRRAMWRRLADQPLPEYQFDQGIAW